jgi:3-polyprenyl-4-hydroxybenzoate decarboxylase
LALNEKKEFNIKLMTYTGSIQQQIDNAVFKQRLSLGAVAATALLGLAMQAFAESNYDAYLNASSSSDATSLYDKTALQDMIAAGSYVAAGAMIIPAAKFTIDIGKLKKQLTEK